MEGEYFLSNPAGLTYTLVHRSNKLFGKSNGFSSRRQLPPCKRKCGILPPPRADIPSYSAALGVFLGAIVLFEFLLGVDYSLMHNDSPTTILRSAVRTLTTADSARHACAERVCDTVERVSSGLSPTVRILPVPQERRRMFVSSRLRERLLTRRSNFFLVCQEVGHALVVVGPRDACNVHIAAGRPPARRAKLPYVGVSSAESERRQTLIGRIGKSRPREVLGVS